MAYTSFAQVGKSLIGNAKGLAASLLDPFVNYRFCIEIEGIELMGFNKMSPLENETEIEEFKEGGLNHHSHKLPKATTYKSITFEHGLSIDNSVYNWREDVIKGKISDSLRSGTIKVYSQNFMRSIWHFHGAWPSKLTIAELDSSAGASGQVLIESFVLEIERFERTVVADPTDMMMDMAKDTAAIFTKPLGKFAGKIKKAVKDKVNDEIDKKKDQLDSAVHKVTDPIVDAAHKVTDPLEDKMYADGVQAKKDKKARKKAKADKQKARDNAHDPKKRAEKKEKEAKAAADTIKKEEKAEEKATKAQEREDRKAARDEAKNAKTKPSEA